MSRRSGSWFALLAASLILCLPAVVLAQADASMSQPMVHGMKDMKFGPVPGMPSCAQGAVQSGDPASGPSLLLAKMAPNCSIPWHWHTPNEQLMVVSGEAHVQTKDGQPQTITAGSYAMMPSKHVHQFHCAKACTLFVQSDAAFDIHYVDAQGKELSVDDALKAVKETAGNASATGAATKSQAGSTTKSQTGTTTKPQTGSTTKPQTGSTTKSQTGTATKPPSG
jgi:quercetin dioxygenase-like cupin family protein